MSFKKINSKGFSSALLYPVVTTIFILSIIAIPIISYAAPGVPYDVLVNRFSASDTALTVSWKNTGFGAGSGNRIWMNGRVTSIATTALNATYKVTGLSAGVNYVFKIGAYDNTGYSDYSFPAAAITKTSAASTAFGMPHASFNDTTNMCSACHSVHKARTKYKILKFRYSNLTTEYNTPVSGAPSESLPAVDLCFNCHDGSGAKYNAKKFYDQPTSAAIPWPGHMTRRASTTASEASFGGWRYMGGQPAGQRQPCMVCHDVHVSTKGNWKSLADGLVDYAKSVSGAWNNGNTDITSDATSTGVIDTGTNPWEKCTVCHHDNSNSNGIMRVAGRDMFFPNSSNGTPPGELTGTKDHTGITNQDNCLCHVGESTDNINNVHALSKEPVTPMSACTSCHRVLEQRMMSSSITSRHYISQSTDNTVPNAGTCVSKCHNNHPRNENTHAANVYVDAPTRTGSAAYDYNASTGEGLCLSCHKNTQNSPITTSNSTKTVSFINTSSFKQSAHNYDSLGYGPTHFTPTKFTGNCIKCHRDNSSNSFSQWGPHASSNRSLLALPTSGQGLGPANSELLCFECHSQKSSSGKEQMWAGRQIATVSWKISQAFNQSPAWGHSLYLKSTSASLDRHRASEAYTASWVTGWMPSTARHVECYDCHNPHQATQGYNYQAALPLITSANNSSKDLEGPTKGYVSGPLRGVSGIYPTQNWNSIPTAAAYAGSYNSTTPVGRLFFTASASKQVYICLKCHSAYAYGTSGGGRPSVPGGVPGPGNFAGTIESPLQAGPQSDILADFNPNNIGYHPIFSPGRNQPAHSKNAANWAGIYAPNSIAYGTQTNVGLTASFVPPWGGSSLLTCSDCHGHQSSSYSRGYYTSAASTVNSWDFPRGPHGSSRRWMLKNLDRTISILYNNNTRFNYSSISGGVSDPNRIFCLNCHRADVYYSNAAGAWSNTAVAQNLSRADHNPAANSEAREYNAAYNIWGVACMNCHAGASLGTIHGTGGAAPDTASIPSAPRLGYRLIYGASWDAYTASVSLGIECSTISSANLVSNCTDGTRSIGSKINYDY